MKTVLSLGSEGREYPSPCCSQSSLLPPLLLHLSSGIERFQVNPRTGQLLWEQKPSSISAGRAFALALDGRDSLVIGGTTASSVGDTDPEEGEVDEGRILFVPLKRSRPRSARTSLLVRDRRCLCLSRLCAVPVPPIPSA